MDFALDARTESLRQSLLTFMADRIEPSAPVFHEQLGQLADPWAWTEAPILGQLQSEAQELGLWNLFLPVEHADSPGLTNLQYAPLAEITGRCGHLAPAALNCAAPDTGNMEVLSLFGTPEQKERWLEPLLKAEIRSAFAMTEPDVASSDATNIETRIERDGDEYVLNGRKWWITGAMNPHAEIMIVMGKTDPSASRHRQQSMVLVPRDTPGVEVVRGMEVFGYDDHEHGGHAELRFNDVRVPVTNLIGDEGTGFAIAQARLGPGRIHHCMRAIGVAERALALMVERARTRIAFGKPLAEQGMVQHAVAVSRNEIDQARLLCHKAAWTIDQHGNKEARNLVAQIKAVAPQMTCNVIDRAIQVHGGAGVSDDFPLARMYGWQRAMRIFDGPDEVHLRSIARAELGAEPSAMAAAAIRG